MRAEGPASGGDHFDRAVAKECRCQHNANIKSQPSIELLVIQPFPVEHGPNDRSSYCQHRIAKRPDPVKCGVTAAIGEDGDFVAQIDLCLLHPLLLLAIAEECKNGFRIHDTGGSDVRDRGLTDSDHRRTARLLLWRWCVLSENIVPRFDRLVARKTGFQIGLGVNLPVFKLSKSPAARRCIFV